MNSENQHVHITFFTNKIKSTLNGKGDDYSTNDRLSNFKFAGAITGVSPEINCLNLIATKVARLGVLLKSRVEPKNESIKDSVLDLACYAVLLDELIEDRKEEKG